MSVCGFGLRGKEVGTPIPRLGYGLHLPLMVPAPGDRSPQGYINLDEDPSPRSSVKLSVNRSISSLFVVSFLLFFQSFNQSIVKPLAVYSPVELLSLRFTSFDRTTSFSLILG